MALAIDYTARRHTPLSPQEITVIQEIVRRHFVDEQIEPSISLGSGLNWEPFKFSLNISPSRFLKRGIIFSGSTKLPDNQEDASWIGVLHWCKCLSEIRMAVNGCEWNVNVEAHKIQWDNIANAYDPTR